MFEKRDSVTALKAAHEQLAELYAEIGRLTTQEFGPINRKRVQRSMREMGIAGIAPGPNLSKRASEHRIYPYLLRHITAQEPNHIWGCDIHLHPAAARLALPGGDPRLV